MKLKKITDIVGKNKMPWHEIPVLRALRDKVDGEECWVAVYSYIYGFIQGKRHERAKRRNSKGDGAND